MNKQINQLEMLQEQIDAESLYMVQKQKKQLENVQNALNQSQSQLTQLNHKSQYDEVQILTLQQQISAQIPIIVSKEQQITDLQAQVSHFKAQCFYLQSEIQLLQDKNTHLETVNRVNLDQLAKNNVDQDTFARFQQQFQQQKQKLIEQNQIQQQALEQKEADINQLAQKCHQFISDNEKLAQKAILETQKCNQIVLTTKAALQVLNEQFIKTNQLKQKISFLSCYLDKSLDTTIQIKNQVFNKSKAKLIAILRGISFIQKLKQVKNQGIVKFTSYAEQKRLESDVTKINNLQTIDLQNVCTAPNPIHALGFRYPYVLKQRPSYARDIFSSISDLIKQEQKQNIKILPEVVTKVFEMCKTHKDIQNQAKNHITNNQMIKSQMDRLTAENRRLFSEITKQQAQITLDNEQNQTLSKTVEDLNNEVSDLNKKLTVQEQNLNRENLKLQKSNKQLSTDNSRLKAEVDALSVNLNQKTKEYERTQRDLCRANVRAKTKMDEIENARGVVSTIAGENILEEKKRRLRALEMKMREMAVE
ncbi:Conserved_hypothetical protein [Hexamita inflata]|uniref:Uncharacterized protein n=1 Tax=Hexamita inflata TaxID=28002 RepID=A0AA86TJE9_9EUKA|nr:Conserved hypothetical protein [Hexamita inflata]